MPLNIKQRFGAVVLYLFIMMCIGYYFSNNWDFLVDTNNKLNVVLIVTGLALVLSTYITEPYFSKPVDVITRWIAVFLFLVGLNGKEQFLFYDLWLILSIIFTFSALLLIFAHGVKIFEKYQQSLVYAICQISRPDVVFTLLYFDIVISFFDKDSTEFPILIGFGFLLSINKPVNEIVKLLSRLFKNFSTEQDSNLFIGSVIGHVNADLYKVEIESENTFRKKGLKGNLIYLESGSTGVIGIVLNERILLGKKWIEILSLRDKDQNLIVFDIKSLLPLAGEKSIFSKSNSVYLLNEQAINAELRTAINNTKLKKNFKNFVGCVWEGSTISKIRFNKLFTDELQIERNIGEGSIVETIIGNEEVIYQIIDGRTNEENLEYKDTHGYTVGTGQKLGKYLNDVKELSTVKWLPEIYTPVFLLEPYDQDYKAKDFIGRLPNTNYGIPIKNPSELVTHNTAILGILGIGKSCLTFEILQKLILQTEVKIFCIDLTNQYSNELPKYVDAALIQNDLEAAIIAEIRAGNNNGNSDNPASWGNEELYKAKLSSEIENFVNSDKRILLLNPDFHNVSKAASSFKINNKIDLTPAEKTRIISERLIVKASSLGETDDARFLIVFEEAHSLVPEWNSVSSDGDKNATNGTAKVILQGRKFGLGSLVVTQRTANISKSILNQCNTIFALRVFDDTGKQFLENYIGTDYSNLLPTLEERHCIAIGKAMKLKQPVILQLNNMDEIKIN